MSTTGRSSSVPIILDALDRAGSIAAFVQALGLGLALVAGGISIALSIRAYRPDRAALGAAEVADSGGRGFPA